MSFINRLSSYVLMVTYFFQIEAEPVKVFDIFMFRYHRILKPYCLKLKVMRQLYDLIQYENKHKENINQNK